MQRACSSAFQYSAIWIAADCRAHRRSEAEQPAAIVLDHPHFIVKNSIDPELGQKEARIVDETAIPIIPQAKFGRAQP